MYHREYNLSFFSKDLLSGIAVFLVAIPLCLGIALASNVPLISGLIAGVVGGVIVGSLSKSHTSVSGPAVGLVAVILNILSDFGNYEALFLAIVLAGIMQIIMGSMKIGTIANYIPSNVIIGLLGAIGVIVILKQIPHLVGYDADTEGDFSFFQSDGENTISAVFHVLSHIHPGAMIVGAISIASMILWEKKITHKKLKMVPPALIAVVVGVISAEVVNILLPGLALITKQFVNIPFSGELSQGSLSKLIIFPDFSYLSNVKIYLAALVLAIIASIETLLNIESADKLDRRKRYTDPNNELIAQGMGNTFSGLIGGLPITSVIIRSSVNIHAGARTKVSTIIHGTLLLSCALLIPNLLNKIPLSALAAVLIITGYKLAKISIFKEMYKKGMNQFIPFLSTLVAIVFTDLLIGVLIGLAIGLYYVLHSSIKHPFRFVYEKYSLDEIIRIELPQQVSFLNKSSFMTMLHSLPQGSRVIIDASNTDYIDHDVLEVIREFRSIRAPLQSIKLNLIGFRKYKAYNLPKEDNIQFVNVLTKDKQKNLSPDDVLKILKEGNERFTKNKRYKRDLLLQVKESANDQHPMAVVLSCIDSRTSVELVFDLGLGDIFSVRIAGNVVNDDVVGSTEFACKVAGAKLILVLGHTNCGAIKAACDHVRLGKVSGVLDKVGYAILKERETPEEKRNSKNDSFVNNVAHLNVNCAKESIIDSSPILKEMLENKEIKIVSAMYDVHTGGVKFLD